MLSVLSEAAVEARVVHLAMRLRRRARAVSISISTCAIRAASKPGALASRLRHHPVLVVRVRCDRCMRGVGLACLRLRVHIYVSFCFCLRVRVRDCVGVG